MRTPKQLFERRYNQIDKEYRSKLLKARELLKKRQKDCKHKFTYYPDPSGNNDSWDICDYCDLKQ